MQGKAGGLRTVPWGTPDSTSATLEWVPSKSTFCFLCPRNPSSQDELEKVQKRAARFVTGNYTYETGSMIGILEQLKWESLKKRSKDSRFIMFYKGLKGAASIPMDDLVPPNRRTRNHYSLAFQTPLAGTDFYYKSGFFPQTTTD